MPQRNILLIIADDYGIDATRFYPKTDRRVTTPPAPATPNLAAAGGGRPPVPQCLGAAELLADAGHDHDRALRLPHRHRQAGAEGPERARCPCSSPTEFTLPEAFAQAFAARPDEPIDLALIGKWHLSRGIDDPELQAGTTSPGPHPSLAALDELLLAGPRS